MCYHCGLQGRVCCYGNSTCHLASVACASVCTGTLHTPLKSTNCDLQLKQMQIIIMFIVIIHHYITNVTQNTSSLLHEG